MRKNILITGGAGNIGGSLSRELVRRGYFVTIIDNLTTGSLNKLPLKKFKNWEFIKKDVNNCNLNKIIKKKIDYIFHYAAVVGVQRTLQNPIQVLNDVKGLENIFKLCVKYKTKRIFYASSSEIYGEPVTIPQNEETTPLNSRLPYAIVKNVGEAFFKSFKKTRNLNFTIFRFFNTYGPLQSDQFVISKFIKNALQNKNIIINGDGKQTRTFLFVDDNINITLSILEKSKFINNVVNIGNDKEITIKELALKIKKILKSKSKIIHKSALLEGDMRRRKPSIKKIKKIYKNKFHSLEKGIILTSKFIR